MDTPLYPNPSLSLPRTDWQTAAVGYLSAAWFRGEDHFPCGIAAVRQMEGTVEAPAEMFSAMVIADLLFGRSFFRPIVGRALSAIERHLGADDVLFFFKDRDRLPADADCTAMGLSVLLRSRRIDEARAHRALDRVLENTGPTGAVATYLTREGARAGIVDAVVCANVLYFAALLGRTRDAAATERHVEDHLARLSGGTRYYPSEDTILYGLARLVAAFPSIYAHWGPAVRLGLGARIGATRFPLDLAQRVRACQWLGVEAEVDRATLRRMQRRDGSWPNDGFFRMGRSAIYFGSRALTTAFAAAALAGKEPLG